jgi:hypothetical protein
MSTALVAAEIKRFLASKEPEVLCIKGKWGVGKTFAWRTYLADAQATGKCRFDQYSYVSLFGLNTLDDLRYAIVEGTVPPAQAATGPTVETMSALLRKGFGKARPYLDTALAFAGKKDAGIALAKAAFLLVRNQLVCFDDLERAGKGLEARDVLGLASSLKEQRGCKVVLLLNDEEMEDDARKEFERQLEKVVDVSLVFDPTSPEAAAIALPENDPVSDMLRDRIVKLAIVNIRVIKKVERLAERLSNLLQGFSQPIREQAVSTVTLGAWAVLQPGDAPNLDFLRRYNTLTTLEMREQQGEDEQAKAESKWQERLSGYPFLYADDLDQIIFDGVKRGFFDDVALLEKARAAEVQLAASPDHNSFFKAWEKLHGSLTIDDDEVLDGLYTATKQNLSNIDAMNLNSAIRLFRKFGRNAQANEIVSEFVATHAEKREFFKLSNHCFMAEDEIDPALRQAFDAHYSSFVDDRDPREVLLAITSSSSWSGTDLRLLGRLTSDGWVQLLDGIKGKELPRAIKIALELAPHSGELSEEFQNALLSALQQIAARSPLRAYRMGRFGISVPQDPAVGPSDG